MNDDRPTMVESQPSPAPGSETAEGEGASDLEAGRRLGPYEIVRVLGRGGMGTVYLAKQLKLDRLVVVKVIAAKFASQPAIVGRLHREALAAGKISSDHVVQVFDCDTKDGVPFIVMEYIEGPTVHALRERSYRLAPAEATRIVLEAARGLKAAHEVGVLHRDVKPANLLVGKDGRVKVADFGLAKLVASGDDPTAPSGVQLSVDGQILGTPAYMAPEQAEGKTVDARTDLYALGVTYYELLTGQLPFRGPTPVKIIASALKDPVPPPRSLVPQIPEAMEHACLALMARNRHDRPQNMEAAIRLLEGVLAGSAAPSSVAPAADPSASHRRSGPRVVLASAPPPPKAKPADWTVLLAVVVILATLGCLGSFFYHRHMPKPPPADAAPAAPPPPQKPSISLPSFGSSSSEGESDEDKAQRERLEKELQDLRAARENEKAAKEKAEKDKDAAAQAAKWAAEDAQFKQRRDELDARETKLIALKADLEQKEQTIKDARQRPLEKQAALRDVQKQIDAVRLDLESVAQAKLDLLKQQETAIKARK
jgi:serine/threonine protein kinase